ncbi:PREDICTED: uncharacterized protein LOC105569669 isoform X2 [Vollenhovia emeryi]|uniref:uncharacterized protein LOC105569669 isoform X2 n=1 Tax=Vollenhovia emeryi TaxID=411798 RepID=UPI0005F44606|nr:PREDICTED: uncharacterized protein LOC105569669 isoform X2 [Vollenhovia emeryi]
MKKSESCTVVKKLVNFDVISIMCDAMQASNEDFVRNVLKCFEILNNYTEFYESQTAIKALQMMLRLSYCINISLNESTLFEKLIQSIADILVRSLQLNVSLDTDCILQQIVLFVQNLDIEVLQKNTLKFAAITILNVVLQKQAVFDDNTNEEMIIDVSHKAIHSMTKIVKYDDDDDTILLAANSLCSTCASSSRFCFMQVSRKESEPELQICEKKICDLEICVYDKMMEILIPYVKDADLSRLDSVGFYRNLVSALNHLYQLKNCDKDSLSNHLAANGYLKRFVYLTVEFPENLRRSTCILLSRILSILGSAAFSIETAKLEKILYPPLLQLPKDLTKWSHSVECKKDGSVLIVLLYYHFLNTRENLVTLEMLTTRVMILPTSIPISILILKPLWLLFAVTSLSHPSPNTVYQYENAVNRLTSILQHSEIRKFYTHDTDLLHYCFNCLNNSEDNLLSRIFNLWLIESDGDINPLLSKGDKILRHLWIAIRHESQPIVNVAMKGFRHLVQAVKDNERLMHQIVGLVWCILPDIFSSYQPDNVAHIETALELVNTVRPSTIPIPIPGITRSSANIINIILQKNSDLKFMTLIIEQAYMLLDVAMSCKLSKVLDTYVNNFRLLTQLYEYGFSKKRSQLSTASIKLLAYIIYCQKKLSVKCKRPLKVSVKNVYELLNVCAHVETSPDHKVNEMHFIHKLLISNNDGSAIILKNVRPDKDNIYLCNLYLAFYSIRGQKYIEDLVYQGLVILLHFCNTNATKLIPYFCTMISTYDFILNVNMQLPSNHFVKFIATWLHYCKTRCMIPLWDPLFERVLDKLKEYLVLLNNNGMKDAHLELQSALSQFK